MSRPSAMRLIVVATLVAGLLLTLSGVIDRAVDHIGLGPAPTAATRYLDQAFGRSLRTFGVLSSIKVALAIVEGTEVGIGFGLQVGDAVQSTYDYVDIAWRTVLAGGVVLIGTRYLLDAAGLVGRWILGAALFAALALSLLGMVGEHFERMRGIIRDLSLALTVAAVSIYVVLPVAVSGARILSQRIIEPSLSAAQEELTAFDRELEQHQSASSGFMQQLGNTAEQVKQIGRYLSSRSKELSQWAFRLIAGYLFDCIVFPLGLFVMLFWLLRGAARYLYGYYRTQSTRELLTRLLDSSAARHSP